METKCCSRCNEIKDNEKFIKKRNICKECSNKWSKIARDKRYTESLITNTEKICNVCNESKCISDIIKNRYLCKDCYNAKYRDKYKSDDEYRLKQLIKDKNKNREVSNKAQKKRYNSNPIEKFMKTQRSRIAISLKNKQKYTIEYLGCDAKQYFNWLQYNFNDNFKFENHGIEWHIDHVIPLSHFDLENEEEQQIAFNWRNTMPLSVKENLKKGINIISLQIEQHLEKLKEYHLENKLDLPQVFIDLFAKYLVDGKPLKLSLPL